MEEGMSYVIEREVVKRYEITDMLRFMKYDFFTKARKGMRKTPRVCFRCGHEFVGSDWIYLGVVKGDKNRIFCEKCGKHVISIFEIQRNTERICTK